MRALTRLDDVPAARVRRHAVGLGLGLGLVPNADAELLDVCAKLRERQAEWQRLWAAVSEDSDGKSPEDRALDDYSERVWPGTRVRKVHDEDLPAQLLNLCATTPEGRAAKAAAIVAMEDVYDYLDIEICGRDDDSDLQMSALRDCAGGARIPVGEDAE